MNNTIKNVWFLTREQFSDESFLKGERQSFCKLILNHLENNALDKMELYCKRLILLIDSAAAEKKIETEGNACEVLRQIRDSLYYTKTEYSNEQTVQAVKTILNHMILEDVISPEFAEESAGIMMDHGLEICAPLPDFTEEDIP